MAVELQSRRKEFVSQAFSTIFPIEVEPLSPQDAGEEGEVEVVRWRNRMRGEWRGREKGRGREGGGRKVRGREIKSRCPGECLSSKTVDPRMRRHVLMEEFENEATCSLLPSCRLRRVQPHRL